MKKIIGIDFDDVIVSTNEALAQWHNRAYGTSYQKKDIVQWDLGPLWNCSREEQMRRIDEFYCSSEHSSVLPICGAIEAIDTLRKENFLCVVTARPKHSRVPTLSLVERYTPFLSDKIYFTGDGVFTKAEMCIRFGIEVFVDDNLDNAYCISALTGIHVLLFDNPWNQVEELPSNVERVYSWGEILEKVY